MLERDLFCAVDGSLGCVWYEYLDCQRRNEYQETKAKERKKERKNLEYSGISEMRIRERAGLKNTFMN